jgi:hypothetical protein
MTSSHRFSQDFYPNLDNALHKILLCFGIPAADHLLQDARRHQHAVLVYLDHLQLAQPDQVSSNQDPQLHPLPPPALTLMLHPESLTHNLYISAMLRGIKSMLSSILPWLQLVREDIVCTLQKIIPQEEFSHFFLFFLKQTIQY